jgi:hypothetical protein
MVKSNGEGLQTVGLCSALRAYIQALGREGSPAIAMTWAISFSCVIRRTKCWTPPPLSQIPGSAYEYTVASWIYIDHVCD